MLAARHRKAAEDIEQSVQQLQGNPQAARLIIEGAWGASFHWIAYACQTKHQKHRESHKRLAAFLRDEGESIVADWWNSLDSARQGGWYGGGDAPGDAQAALDLLAEIRNWALS